MKLRSIVTAGLLGTGLLMMSGCDWLDDEVEDALPKVASVSVVNNVPGGSPIDVTVDGDTQSVAYQGNFTYYPTVTTSDKVRVSYAGGDAITVSSSGIHVIGINTDCISSAYVKDTLDINKIRVMNLTTADLTSSEDINITYNGAPVVFPTTVGACASVSAHDGSLVGEWKITISGGETHTINVLEETLISGYELIVYDTETPKGYVIPLFPL
jgi:hypothetical protein